MKFVIKTCPEHDRVYIGAEGYEDNLCEVFAWAGMTAQVNAAVLVMILQGIYEETEKMKEHKTKPDLPGEWI